MSTTTIDGLIAELQRMRAEGMPNLPVMGGRESYGTALCEVAVLGVRSVDPNDVVFGTALESQVGQQVLVLQPFRGRSWPPGATVGTRPGPPTVVAEGERMHPSGRPLRVGS